MSSMPKRRQQLSALTNTTRQALKSSATVLGKQKFLPKGLRNKLNRLGRPKRQTPPDNRRKKTPLELQKYIVDLQSKEVSKTIIRDFRELAHYAYIFDLNHYKSQLEPQEAQKLESIGDVIFHYCSLGRYKGLDPSNLFETDNYPSKYPDIRNSGLNPLVHFFKFGIHENRYSMDNIHFMRKMADIKKADTSGLDPVKNNLKGKRLAFFCTFSTLN